MRMGSTAHKSGAELATCKALGIPIPWHPSKQASTKIRAFVVEKTDLHVEGKPVHGCNACAVHFGPPTRSSSS